METLFNNDCLNVLKTLPENSIDSLVTDPPAGISFMGKHWDDDKGGRDHWISWMSEVMREAHRVLKPGAHGLVWALPRTSHWTATALENAGFEVRDVVIHLFGSGFPKSSALNRQNRDAFCQCASSTHNNEYKNPLPNAGDHSDKENVLGGGAPQSLDAQHLKNKPLNSQDGYHQPCDSCDVPSRVLLVDGLTSLLLQGCVPTANHSGAFLDEQSD